MIPASYLFKGAYRGGWGTPQVPTEEEVEIAHAIRAAARRSAGLEPSTAAKARVLLAGFARFAAIQLYRWSRTVSRHSQPAVHYVR